MIASPWRGRYIKQGLGTITVLAMKWRWWRKGIATIHGEKCSAHLAEALLNMQLHR